jgi:hypothetical protein
VAGACVAGTGVVAGEHAPSSKAQITNEANNCQLIFFMFFSSFYIVWRVKVSLGIILATNFQTPPFFSIEPKHEGIFQ